MASHLPIKSSSSNPSDSTTFTNHKLIESFSIHQDKSVVTGQQIIAKLKSSQTDTVFSKLYAKINPSSVWSHLSMIDLGTGTTRSTFIESKSALFEHNQSLYANFYKQLATNHYFMNKEAAGLDFICLDEILIDSMLTPTTTATKEDQAASKWEFYALKFHNVLFLWKNEGSSVEALEKLAARFSGGVLPYYQAYLKHLLTNDEPSASAPNVYHKTFGVSSVRFGDHRLGVLSEIDALAQDEQIVSIDVIKEKLGEEAKGKDEVDAERLAAFYKAWAKSNLQGIQTCIFGCRNTKDRLASVEQTKTDQLIKEQGLDVKPCLEFENRLLSWIKDAFKDVKDDDTDKVVKVFSWDSKKSQDDVTVCNLDPIEATKIYNEILPAKLIQELELLES